MSRPLDRLLELGLVRRELPFGESERGSKRALYKISDPFFRLWFRVVAPHRAQLASGTPAARRLILTRHWDSLRAQSWEDLCRQQVAQVVEGRLAERGPWGPASRWWQGTQPEWDVVSESIDGERVLIGEVKWSARPFSRKTLEPLLRDLAVKSPPPLPGRLSAARVVRALFVPEVAGRAGLVSRKEEDGLLITAADLLGA